MTSGHRYMVRERFDRASLLIADAHARHYVARLVRQTVREAPSERWITQELLDGIDWVFAKLDEHRSFADQDLVVIVDTFGPNHERYTSGSRSTTTPPRGNPPAHHDLAEAFVTTNQPSTLARLELALRRHGGTGRVQVDLVADDEGGHPRRSRAVGRRGH